MLAVEHQNGQIDVAQRGRRWLVWVRLIAGNFPVCPIPDELVQFGLRVDGAAQLGHQRVVVGEQLAFETQLAPGPSFGLIGAG